MWSFAWLKGTPRKPLEVSSVKNLLELIVIDSYFFSQILDIMPIKCIVSLVAGISTKEETR